MTCFPTLRRVPLQQDLASIFDEFKEVFEKEMAALLCIATHLTADAETAEICLIRAMRDCFQKDSLAGQGADTWARRMLFQNAIRMVLGIEHDFLCDESLEFLLQPRQLPIEALADFAAIRSLPDFDRVVFVICVLERYAVLDCALLLGKAPREVHDAIVRAMSRVAPAASNYLYSQIE